MYVYIYVCVDLSEFRKGIYLIKISKVEKKKFKTKTKTKIIFIYIFMSLSQRGIKGPTRP